MVSNSTAPITSNPASINPWVAPPAPANRSTAVGREPAEAPSVHVSSGSEFVGLCTVVRTQHLPSLPRRVVTLRFTADHELAASTRQAHLLILLGGSDFLAEGIQATRLRFGSHLGTRDGWRCGDVHCLSECGTRSRGVDLLGGRLGWGAEGCVVGEAVPVAAVGDPSGDEQAGLASDISTYLPNRDAWIELRQYATTQYLVIDTSLVPGAWADAVAQAQPGQIAPGTTAVTIEGTRHRSGTWNGQPVTSEHPVSFTVFVVCAPTYQTCHLLRLSQLDNPLR